MKRSIFKLLFAAILSVCCTLATRAAIDYPNWMSTLPDEMLVSQLSIPGAHDAGTNSLSGISKTQSLSISEQLEAGVRCLDYRLSYTSSQLYIRHGLTTTSITGETAFGYLKTFLNAHPTEGLFVILKHEEDSESAWADAVSTLLSKFSSYFVTFKPDLTVGNIRGKILLMTRDTYSGTLRGASFGSGWSNNATSTNTLRNASGQSVSVRIQDIYDGHESATQTKKKADIATLLQESTTNKGTTLFINHTSGCNKATVILSYVINTVDGMKSCAAECNNIVIDYMKSHMGPMGIIMADYIGVDTYDGTTVYGKQLIDCIINNAYKTTAFVAIAKGEKTYQLTQPRAVQAGTTKLITTASQLKCNCPDPSEGTNIGNLIDNNASTFFHSSWHNDYADYKPHDLQVSLPSNKNTVFWLKYTDRNNGSDHIKTMKVYGSNDKGKTYSSCLATITLPGGGSGYTGEMGFSLGNTPYTYYKFAVTDCYGNDGYRIFWHCAEFQLYDGAMETTYKVSSSCSAALRTAIDNLQQKINSNSVTTTDIEAVYKAIENVEYESKNYIYILANEAIAKGETAYQLTQPRAVQTGTTKLITTASQLKCNCPDPNEGTNIGYLIDNDASTFFHSSYHNDYTNYKPHDLQVSLPANKDTVFWLKYTNRTVGSDHIKTMKVYGSNDNGKTYSSCLATITLPDGGNGYTGEIGFSLGNTPYTYYKFAVTDCSGNDGYRIFWHCAEFQLYAGAMETTYQVFSSCSAALRKAIDDLQKKVNAKTVTEADIATVYEAITEVEYQGKNYILGDANADHEVTVSDFTAIANYILAPAPDKLIFKAADVNKDNAITVSDLTGVANIILQGK